jgi:hypothetical protein
MDHDSTERLIGRLLAAGYEVTFASVPGISGVTCHTIDGEGDGITATGATPAAALAAASPLPAVDLATATTDDNGEHPGDAGAAPGPLSWILSEGKWRAQLADGRTAVIEVLREGDDSGHGAALLPRVYESATDFETGPVCAGLLSAAAWVAEYAGTAR